MAHIRTVHRLFRRAGDILSPFLSFVYPPSCLSCNTPLDLSAGPVCAACWSSVNGVRIDDPAYQKALTYLLQTGACDGLIVPLYFEEGGVMQRLIHALKYDGLTEVGGVMGARIAAAIPGKVCAAGSALIVPVPLHAAKLRERGYNQADWIAAGMGRFLGVPVRSRLVRRVRHTPTQTHLDVAQRRANVAGAFRVLRGELPGGGPTVLLADDVVTTGATIGACAGALKEAGAQRVYACAAALAG
ncbi:MAG TPA: hypothetical protein VF889_02760 [Bacteroidota bacterium]